MKNIIKIIVADILVMIVLTSCGLSKTDKQEEKSSATAFAVKTMSEYYYPTVVPFESYNHFEDTNATVNASITFDEEKYIGTYDYSYYSMNRPYKIHRYKCDEVYWFEINGETGDLISIYLKSDGGGYGGVTADDARNSAVAFAEKYISVSDYALEEDSNDKSYIFRFNKKIHGIESSDDLSITVSKSNGEITGFSIGDTGAFNEDAYNTVFDIEKAADGLLKEKVADINPECNGYNLTGKKVVCLTEGYGIVYSIGYTYPSETERIADSELFDIIIYPSL